MSKSDELAAACLLYPDACKQLKIPEPEFFGNVANRRHLRDLFTFNANELVHHIETNPGLAEVLHGKSLDQRSSPSAYMIDASGGYSVGWYDGEYSEEHFHRRIEDAAADFVLAYWGLPRL